MISVMELAIVVLLAWALLQVWFFWQRQHPSKERQSVPEAFKSQIQAMAVSVKDHLLGRRGRKRQALAILSLVAAAMLLGIGRSLLAVVVAIVIFAIATRLRENEQITLGSANPPVPPAPPVPPPPPHRFHAADDRRERTVPREVQDEPVPQPRESRLHQMFRWVAMLILFGIGATVLFEFDEVRRFLGEHVPQARGFVEESDDDAATGVGDLGDRIARRVDELTGRITERVDDEVRSAIERAERAIERPKQAVTPKSPPTPAKTKDVSAPRMEMLPVDAKPSSTSGDVVSFPTEPAPTKEDARRLALAMASRYLAMKLLDSGRVPDMHDWQPNFEWTQRHFVESLDLKRIPSESGDVDVYYADVRVDVPDENGILQIWNEYKHDQSAARSVVLLKAFAGSVFMVGGLSVLLRLGTGRHFPQGNVSLRRKWFGRRRAVKV